MRVECLSPFWKMRVPIGLQEAPRCLPEGFEFKVMRSKRCSEVWQMQVQERVQICWSSWMYNELCDEALRTQCGLSSWKMRLPKRLQEAQGGM